MEEVTRPNAEAVEKVLRGVCPSCGALDLHFGPRGGMSTNFACFSCRARFNAAFVAGDVVFFSQEGMITEEETTFFLPTPIHERLEPNRAALTDDDLGRIEMNVWLDGRIDDDRRLLLEEVKRLRAERALRPRYIVAGRDSSLLWETASGERVYVRREDASAHLIDLERIWPELAERLAVFEAYLIIDRESPS